MQGILLVDKPIGWTSFDVVNYVRKLVAHAEGRKPKNTKVGHTGTLDPFASGLLVLLIGKEYTRRAAELAKVDKTYEVTMRLGEESTTGDPEGEIAKVADSQPTLEEIKAALAHFIGEIEQTPPVYSAIKVNGVRAYKLAREGKTVTLESRKITIYSSDVMSYDYPEVRFIVKVSSGTYIRTLVEDIGRALSTGAYTTALRRAEVGNFSIHNCTDLKDKDLLDHIEELE
ncbi:MAG TPA: tRNA pseudouridine(55) synthase TruB [Candidatus Saccharimonadales bacterium]|nr:tRNA pseudouridine(55) synthase TruB [Candidatus Saccharimonadales bacterium]